MKRPTLDQRTREGLMRLRNNTDFALYRKYLEEDLEYLKELLIGETDHTALNQLQGRARQLREQLESFKPKE